MSGSALLDEILAERKRIRAAWTISPTKACDQFQIFTRVPEKLPLLSLSKIKSVEERVAEVDIFCGKVSVKSIVKMKAVIRGSEKDCDKLSLYKKHPSISKIQYIVASHFNITLDQLLCLRHNALILLPRQIAIYIVREMTGNSLPHIARRFGGCDHKTILYSMRKIKLMKAKSWWFSEEVALLMRMVGP